MQLDRPTLPPFPWADRFFTIGTTGTNGKTSTTLLQAAILRAQGESVLVVSTIGYFIDDHLLADVPRTLLGFHEAFRRAAAQGLRFAVVEATSKALAEAYAKRWRFDLGVFTNLSPDHLQTHGSWEHYLAAKAQLFVHLGPGRTAVLNAADQAAQLIDRATPTDVRRQWFHAPSRGPALCEPDLAIATVELDARGTAVTLRPSALAEQLGGGFTLRLVGEVFAENALAAALATLAAGVAPATVVAGLAACAPVPGRFEVLQHDPLIAIDYAHTPDALARTCDSARRLARGRVLVVFGAGGDSSADKREPMGEVVGARADAVWITNDNPRREDPRAIAAALQRGVERGGRARLSLQLDRAAAIAAAIADARPGDVLVIAGKGHERGQDHGDHVLPFCDVDEVRRVLGVGP